MLDCETTGLDTTNDEIIELAMLKFAYSADDRMLGVVDAFQAFQQPSRPIAEEIVELTRITDTMVEGRTIDAKAIVDFVKGAHVVVAHNVSFDRPIAERFWPIFARKPWACSATGVAWKAYGFSGAKLEHLLTRCGLFYDAHRAIDDCDALVTLLGQPLPRGSATVLAVLLERARRKDGAHMGGAIALELKDVLKRRNYRWSDGTDGRPKSWYLAIDEEEMEAELRFLRTVIYQREVDIERKEFTALDRYSDRW